MRDCQWFARTIPSAVYQAGIFAAVIAADGVQRIDHAPAAVVAGDHTLPPARTLLSFAPPSRARPLTPHKYRPPHLRRGSARRARASGAARRDHPRTQRRASIPCSAQAILQILFILSKMRQSATPRTSRSREDLPRVRALRNLSPTRQPVVERSPKAWRTRQPVLNVLCRRRPESWLEHKMTGTMPPLCAG